MQAGMIMLQGSAPGMPKQSAQHGRKVWGRWQAPADSFTISVCDLKALIGRVRMPSMASRRHTSPGEAAA